MRLVLDTDVVVAALRSPAGASAAILLAALDRHVTLLANVALVIEYEATCSRPEHRKAAGLSLAEVDRREHLNSNLRFYVDRKGIMLRNNELRYINIVDHH